MDNSIESNPRVVSGSVGSVGHQASGSVSSGRSIKTELSVKRWATEEPVHTVTKLANATSRLSPSAEAERADMNTTR